MCDVGALVAEFEGRGYGCLMGEWLEGRVRLGEEPVHTALAKLHITKHGKSAAPFLHPLKNLNS